MAIRLGDIAPDFIADTTQGPVSFHAWKANSWAVLFSHPKDFTPVCTTELGRAAQLKPEFEKRNCKINRGLGGSGDIPPEVGGRHQRRDGTCGEFPHDRRPRPHGGHAVRHDSPQRQ